MAQIRWTNRAAADLQSIFGYIAGDSPTYAERHVQEIIKASRILESMPVLGRVVPELLDPSIRELIHGNYRIVYHTTERNEVLILAIVHDAQDFQSVVSGLLPEA